jgi:hypothetical protein
MSYSTDFRASWSVAIVLLASVPGGGVAWAQNIAGDGLAARVEPAASEGAFRHLRALQEIASANGGTRAAGTPGFDRSAEYVAQRLREAGYTVRLEEFEFPFFEDRTPPVLAAGKPGGGPETAPAGAVRTLTNSGSGSAKGRRPRRPAAAKPPTSRISSAARWR